MTESTSNPSRNAPLPDPALDAAIEVPAAGTHSAPAIGIDLDGCIDEAPEWFRILSVVWPGKVYVITFRRDAIKARRDVESFGIRCDEVILVSRFDAKAEVIVQRNIAVYFDDQDEMLLHVPEHVTVFKIRNGGNFDFEARQWLYSDTTGRAI